MLVETWDEFARLKQILNTYAFSPSFNILVGTNSAKIYTEVRFLLDDLNATNAETLVVYVQKKKLCYLDCIDKIVGNPKVFCWDSSTLIRCASIHELFKEYNTYNQNAGLISPQVIGSYFFNIEDVYSSKSEKTLVEDFTQELIPIDITMSGSFVTKAAYLRQYYGDNDVPYKFALTLRQMGYQNYVYTKVRAEVCQK